MIVIKLVMISVVNWLLTILHKGNIVDIMIRNRLYENEFFIPTITSVEVIIDTVTKLDKDTLIKEFVIVYDLMMAGF